MTSLLKVHLVKYECSCGLWAPLCQLHFCKKCAAMKCSDCMNEEIDVVFCPNCMENNSSTDRRQLKHCCTVCYQCPACANLLVTRAQNDRYYLQCNACQWTSRDSGIPDQESASGWPEPTNPMKKHLDSVLAQMKNLSTYEKTERERGRMAAQLTNKK